MSIQGKVNELNSIKNELKSLRQRGKSLRQRGKIIEQEIDDYLDSKDQPGLKYKGTAMNLDLKKSIFNLRGRLMHFNAIKDSDDRNTIEKKI